MLDDLYAHNCCAARASAKGEAVTIDEFVALILEEGVEKRHICTMMGIFGEQCSQCPLMQQVPGAVVDAAFRLSKATKTKSHKDETAFLQVRGNCLSGVSDVLGAK